jgi:hypothetical protein
MLLSSSIVFVATWHAVVSVATSWRHVASFGESGEDKDRDEDAGSTHHPIRVTFCLVLVFQLRVSSLFAFVVVVRSWSQCGGSGGGRWSGEGGWTQRRGEEGEEDSPLSFRRRHVTRDDGLFQLVRVCRRHNVMVTMWRQWRGSGEGWWT